MLAPKPTARRRFGQNFLIDANIIDQIVATIAPKQTDNLLEIGPGKGAITLPLLAKVGQLHAIEIDQDLVTKLSALKKHNLHIYQADALKFDLSTLLTPLRVVGNLPYNISSPLLFHLLDHRAHINDMTLMLQKQVVERITAKRGSKTYGRLSVMMQAFFEVELIFTVLPKSFNPIPKVDSAIIYLTPLTKPLIKDTTIFSKVVKAAFSQRRKTLKNCLKSLLTQPQTSIDLSQRAQMLSVAEFVTLTQDYQQHSNQTST